MTHPQTLLEISGVAPQTIDWSQCALILIDYQHEYTDGKLKLGKPGKASIEVAKKLVEKARQEGTPIYHVIHHGKTGGAAFDPETSNVNIIPELKPVEGEAVVVKRLPNVFAKTGLAEKLHKTNRKQLVFSGFMSHMCVDSSVRAAIDHGFANIVCSDACATRDLSDDAGNIIPAEVVHKVTMASLRDRFATVCRSDILLSQ